MVLAEVSRSSSSEVITAIKTARERLPKAKLEFLTRTEIAAVLEVSPSATRVWLNLQ